MSQHKISVIIGERMYSRKIWSYHNNMKRNRNRIAIDQDVARILALDNLFSFIWYDIHVFRNMIKNIDRSYNFAAYDKVIFL